MWSMEVCAAFQVLRLSAVEKKEKQDSEALQTAVEVPVRNFVRKS